MSDKKMESFKIGDAQKPAVSVTQKDRDAVKQAQAEATSLGFRRIESLLEEQDRDSVIETLGGLKQRLQELHDGSGTHKEKATAKRAATAVDKTMALMAYLYDVKANLESE